MSATLRIDPPLPCATWQATDADPLGRCGQPASVGHADALPDGSYLILPICRACTTAMAKVYGVTASDAEEGRANT
jgi:hypothetical protein